MNEFVTSAIDRLQKEIDAKLETFNKLSPAEKEAVLRMQAESIKEEYKPGERHGIYEKPVDGLAAFMERHRAWIERTFPRNATTEGITRHIEKECAEVREKPEDLDEWIDILILGIHGYWRNGGTAEDLLPRLNRKLTRNESRRYVMKDDPNEPIEHDRTVEEVA
jgi:hypothetical protein